MHNTRWNRVHSYPTPPTSPSSISECFSPNHHDQHNNQHTTSQRNQIHPLPKLSQWIEKTTSIEDRQPSQANQQLYLSSAFSPPPTRKKLGSPTNLVHLSHTVRNSESKCSLGFDFCTHSYCLPAHARNLQTLTNAAITQPSQKCTPVFEYQALHSVSTSYRSCWSTLEEGEREEHDGEHEYGVEDKWDYVWDYDKFRNIMTAEIAESWWTNLFD